MPVRRHFLNWDEPVTRRVREFLLPDDGLPCADAPYRAINLQDTLVIVPTRQAARRLSAALAQHGATHSLALLSARIVPPTFLLQPDPADPRTASATVVAAAWTDLLQHLPPAECPALLPAAGGTPDFEWALRTGQLLQDLRESLADGAYQMADVVRQFGDQLEERERWENLARLETRYLEHLARWNLLDPIAARMAYARRPALPPGVTRVVVASVPDPSLLLLQALATLAKTVQVDILIHAPAALAATFDDWGRPRPDHWTACPITIPDPARQLILEESPRTQSSRVATLLHGTAPADVALGVPDATVTPFLAAALEETGLAAFDPADRCVNAHPLYALIESLTDLAADDSYRALARLLRHPDVLARLAADAAAPTAHANPAIGVPWQLLTQLDTLQNDCLPASLAAVERALLASPHADPRTPYPELHAAVTFLLHHLDALRTTPVESALRAFLQDIYRHRELHPRSRADAEFEAVADKIDRALRELGDAPPLPDLQTPANALRLLEARLSTEHYHPVPGEANLDLEGWLELPWNHAPRLIVTGLNEGCVPDTRIGDAFLPESLRALLALRDDATRLARDSYLLATMIASRQSAGSVTLITGKRSATGDPLKPSRLLFRCPDSELRDRAAQLFGSMESGRPSVHSSVSFRLQGAPPPDVPPAALCPKRLPVTAFRAYLDCPFRFYLAWGLGMDSLDDQKTGVDARDFGVLMHHVLEALADSGLWRSADEPAMRAFMNAETDRWVTHRFGASPPLAVSLAADAARQRLGAAARTQVALTRDGWEILHTEQKLSIVLAGQEVVGKIDRIDRHRDTGQLRIIDYKTSDRPVAAPAAHLANVRPDTPEFALATPDGKKRWIDLQLPLYVALLGQTLGQATVNVGYFNLPKATTDTELTLWPDFSPDLVASATRCAGEVIRRIHARIFWPPTERVDYDRFESLFPSSPAECFTPPFPETSKGIAP
ncbi:MAG: PD-(D/E)XK nuclease family protein [Lentisphaerae bacterium]|nr:PD-(D/E)XK nuclease family protein [Lentisphaerota bacterium]